MFPHPSLRGSFAGLITLAGALAGAAAAGAAEQTAPPARWHVSESAGFYLYEGDELVVSTFVDSLQFGRDVSRDWTVEGVLSVWPYLEENTRVDAPTGQTVSRLEEQRGVDRTWAAGLAVDGLRHVGRGRRLDPYLAAGAGFMWYPDGFYRESLVGVLRAGGGMAWRLGKTLSLRGDLRALACGVDLEVNMLASLGLTWTFGDGVAGTPEDGWVVTLPGNVRSETPAVSPEGEPAAEETRMDSDGDGLTDVDERRIYHTDPLNPDSDWDGLTDGQEVLKYKTDPLKRDTDGGGVADGHEVIEDGTDPLDGKDDLKLYELDMNFGEGQSEISPEYVAVLDAIAKEIKTAPAAKVRVEGHIDRAALSAPDAKSLTAKRAEAIRRYFAEKCAVSNEIEAVGYGFTRPRAANDPDKGNAVNRRMEIYIRGLPRATAPQDK